MDKMESLNLKSRRQGTWALKVGGRDQEGKYKKALEDMSAQYKWGRKFPGCKLSLRMFCLF